MHKTPFKKDAEATKAQNYRSKYSYVSRRIHPGTLHQCEYLAGLEDIGARRTLVFMRDLFTCVDCGLKEGWYDNALELAHGGHTKISRCWCMENLKTKCRRCHGLNDHHGRFA
jgi:hypothetical protein